jgi:transcriptional regulator with XRE-family HTH domain
MSNRQAGGSMKINERSGLRRRAGLTQLRLSRLAKVSPPRISLWENGEIELRPEELERIATVLYARLRAIPSFAQSQDLLTALTPETKGLST